MTDLSILIPSRHEMFLRRTIEDILSNIEGDTEIIAVLDGEWAEPQIEDHPRVILVHHSVSIGQRAATNEAARISTARYVMKVDAHCAFDKGFDVKLMADMHRDWTVAPLMRNLHAFDWVCPNGHRRYQGPSGPCKECGEETTMDVVWIAKNSPRSVSYCFDSEPHFQYFGQFSKRPEGRGDITESMSLQGSCFMTTRRKFRELDLCDEKFGSWGSQGIEVAVKTWLSGGKVMINHKTWYAHMFRTQGGDFGFPYKLSGNQVEDAKKYARKLFFENNWPKQIHPLSWLVEKFWPVNGWTLDDLNKLKGITSKPTVGVLYYTCNTHDPKIEIAARNQLLIAKNSWQLGCVSREPTQFGDWNIVVDLPRSPETMHKQVLAGLERMDADIVYLCESDVLYHPSHFTFIPPDKDHFFYNTNVWKVRYPDGHAVWVDNMQQVSGMCAYRELLLDFYRERVAEIEKHGFDGHYEPDPRVNWQSEFPNLDIRHGKTLTKSKWSKEDFRNQKYAEGWKESSKVPGWGVIEGCLDKVLEIVHA